jgi:hypothetical protein
MQLRLSLMPIKFLHRLLSKMRKWSGYSTSSSADRKRRLAIRGRLTLNNGEFGLRDRLYRGFCLADLEDNGNIDVASFESRDLSCNWDRFSLPSDIRHRECGRESDGCYSITVETARYNNLATACHEPIQPPSYENYAHVEIRWLHPGEDAFVAPPHGRKNRSGKTAKSERLAWRTNAVRQVKIELDVAE